MAENIHEIRLVAVTARQSFEQDAIPRPLLRTLFTAYNPDFLDVDNYIDFSLKRFPKDNCWLASVYLRHVLGDGDVVEGAYNLEAHQYLQIGKLAVDITADQFGGPPVYVGPVVEPWVSGRIMRPFKS